MGFKSIWATDHIIVPQKFEIPYGDLYEIIVTLSYISAITKKIVLGTSVMVLPLREPNLVAKQIATLDTLSNGRAVLGIDVGWMDKEYQQIGVDFHNRGKIIDNSITKLKQFWNGIDEFVSRPNAIQKNGIPIFIGGNSKRAIIRAATKGDGWFPVGLSPTELEQSLLELKKIQKKNLPIYMRSLVEISEKPIGLYKGAEGKTRYSVSGSISQVIKELNQF